MSNNLLSKTCLCILVAFTFLPTFGMPGQKPAKPKVKTVTVTESDAGKTIGLKVGNRLVVRLDSNASTGYSWKVAVKRGGVLKPIGEPGYKSPDMPVAGRAGPPAGAGGTAVYTFGATKAGDAQLVFTYSRPWEKVPPVKTVKFKVHVAK